MSSIISTVTILIEYYYCVAWTEGVAAQRERLAFWPGSPVWGPSPVRKSTGCAAVIISRCLRDDSQWLEKEGTIGNVWVRTRWWAGSWALFPRSLSSGWLVRQKQPGLFPMFWSLVGWAGGVAGPWANEHASGQRWVGHQWAERSEGQGVMG